MQVFEPRWALSPGSGCDPLLFMYIITYTSVEESVGPALSSDVLRSSEERCEWG